MKKIILIFCILSALLLLNSCSKGPESVFEVSSTELNWDWDKTAPQTIQVSTGSKKWNFKLSDETNWVCTKDGGSLTIYPLSANTTPEDITLTVLIFCSEDVITITCTHSYYPYLQGHEFVDLDLPSGMLWATCNLDATSPQDFGNTYGWGSHNPLNNLDWKSYLLDIGVSASTVNILINNYGGETLAMNLLESTDDPYRSYYGNVSRQAGLPDGLAGTKDDIVRQKWGGKWRYPTLSEYEELLKYCDLNKTTKGVEYISRNNGKKIFLPEYEFYWASTMCEGVSITTSNGCAYALTDMTRCTHPARYFAGLLRPVTSR
ncbi:MAG: hypothetical protein HUJ98_01735 [Bacteroidaceae bacterium]|nr:hypothetical protein [Bacteroidaceae bacterium]